eukprot:213466_1
MGVIELAQGRISLNKEDTNTFSEDFTQSQEFSDNDGVYLTVEGSGSITFNFGYAVNVDLSVGFDAKIVFKGFDDPFHVENIEFTVTGGFGVIVNTSLVFEGNVGFKYEPHALQVELSEPKMITLGYIPVVLLPTISFEISGGIDAKFGYKLDLDYYAAYTAGVKYSSSGGFEIIKALDTATPNIVISQDINDPDQACATITANLGTEIKFAVELYKIVVPFVSVTPSIDFEISTPVDPQLVGSNCPSNMCTSQNIPTAILFDPTLSFSAVAGVEFTDEFTEIAELLFNSVDGLPELEMNIFNPIEINLPSFGVCNSGGVFGIPFTASCCANTDLTAYPTVPSQSPTTTTPTTAKPTGNILYYLESGRKLEPGDVLYSLTQNTYLKVETSGNKRLVLKNIIGTIQWYPIQTGAIDVELKLWNNGNLKLKDTNGNLLWESGSDEGSEYGPYQLRVSDEWVWTVTNGIPVPEAMGYVYIVNSRDERVWSSGTSHTPSPTNKYVDADLVSMKCQSNTAYVNAWDGDLDKKKSAKFFNGVVSSVHENDKEDRRFKWRYCAPNGFSGSNLISSNGFIFLPTTSEDAPWNKSCTDLSGWENAAIHAINSVYSASNTKDRRWTILCAKLDSNLYRLENCNWINHDKWINFYDEPMEKVYCPNDGVLRGIKSQHDNHREDRQFKLECCEVYQAFPLPHEIFNIFIDDESVFSGANDHQDKFHDTFFGVPAYTSFGPPADVEINDITITGI